jgi:shikimate kinase
MDQRLRQDLSHLLWIGGATDAGKTTITRIIAERYGFQIYDYDQQDARQINYLAQTIATYRDFLNASDEERWIRPEPTELFQRAIQAFQDRFPLCIEELMALPKEPMIVAEGFGFTPELIFPLLSNHHQAIWLVPTEDFKWMSMKKRGKYFRRLKMSNSERAIHNLFTRDVLLGERVKEEAQQRDLTVVVVDGSRSVEEMATLVEQHFKPYLRNRQIPGFC